VKRIGGKERRARLGVLHHLAAPAPSVEKAAASMVGLHSSDPASVYLSAWARVEGFEPADLEDALYHRRDFVRMLGMRRTLFVVPVDLASIMHEACTKARVPAERRRLVRMLEEQGVVAAGRGERWLDRVASATLEALRARGEASARELTADVPELGTKLSFGQGATWAATVGVSTRVLFLLATEGLIVRARPLGSWTSGQYRWTTIESWLGGSLVEIDHADACAELLARYLRSFGPATMTDLRWWTGWPAKLSATTLGAVGAVEVALDDGVGYVLPGDPHPVDQADPWVALLPGLDPTVMGWKERAWYLGDQASDLFDRNGNAGPTVWANGRVVGAWEQTEQGEIAVELFGRLGAATRKLVDAERESLRSWLGDVRIRTRFATPLGRKLSGR